MRKPRVLIGLGVLLATVSLIAVACGDDATATPAPTQPPPQAAIDTDLIQSLVREAIKAAVPAAPEVVTAAQIQSMVETAVAAAAPEGASPAEIQALVETAVAAASGEGLTSEGVAALVSSAVADAISDQPEPLTAAEIEAIVRAAQPATPTPAPTITPVPTATPIPTPTQAPRRPAVDRLRVAMVVQIETSDPVDTAAAVIQVLPMYEALLRWNEQGKVEPMLAEDWSISSDAKTYAFNLRRGVQFHKDWGEVTAQDVVHSSERHAREGVRSIHSPIFAEEVVGNIDTPDDYTAIINLPESRVGFENLMSNLWYNLILSKDHFDAEGQDGVINNPIGTNAYQYVERSPGSYILFEQVPYEHYRVTPDFQELQAFFVDEASTRLAMLLTDEAHITTLPPDLEDTAINQGFALIKATEPTQTFYVALIGQFRDEILPGSKRVGDDPDLPYSDVAHSVTEVPWVNIKVREALNRAINREELNATILKGRADPAVLTNYHPTLPGWNPRWQEEFQDKYGYDPDRARELLAEVEAEIGQPLDWSGTRIALTIKAEFPPQIDLGEAVANYWREIGADVDIDLQEYAAWRPHLFDMSLAGVAWPNVSTKFEGDNILRIIYYSKNNICCHFIEYDDVDAIFEELIATVDPVRRDELLQNAGDIIYDSYGIIPMFWIFPTFVIDPTVVEDYTTSGRLVLRDLEHVKAVQIRR